MKENIEKMRDMLCQLERQATEAAEVISPQMISGLELPDIISDVVDLLMPNLTPYQAAVYLYLLRHSIISTGTQLVRVSRRSLQTIIRSASGQSDNASYEKMRVTLQTLVEIGAIQQQGDPSREGTPYRVRLPEEIEVCQAARKKLEDATPFPPIEENELDYYNIRENRQKIYERDQYKCQHCGKQLTRFTATLDHLTPVSKGGDNGLTNLVAACRECNAKKNAKPLGDFLADLYPT